MKSHFGIIRKKAERNIKRNLATNNTNMKPVLPTTCKLNIDRAHPAMVRTNVRAEPVLDRSNDRVLPALVRSNDRVHQALVRSN